MKDISARDRLAVALDVPTLDDAERVARVLEGKVGVFKVGLELFALYGPAAVQAASRHGAGIFLDLKLHDIPRTVGAAVRSASSLGVRFITLHALGGPAMIAAAREEAEKAGANRPKLLAVTILTSHGADELQRIGLPGSPADNVARLAAMAIEAGADGLVMSPEEVASIRRTLGPGPVLVTPGIRPAGSAKGDQVRVATPADAIAGGSDLLVIGRPILAAPDPAAAADGILGEIAAALGTR